MTSEFYLPPKPVKTLDERANWCFGCGPENPQGLHLHFIVDASDPDNITATAKVKLTRYHEGPPGYMHGGIIATLLDEAMSKVNGPLGVLAMTRHMEIDYLRPSPLETELTLVGRHMRRERIKLYNEAELLGPDKKVLAKAKGFFLVIDPALARAFSGS